MTNLMKLLVLSVLFCLIPSHSIAQKSGRGMRKAPPPPVLCTTASIPKGMVAVGYKRNTACSTGFEWSVKRPENGDIICAESPLPPEFSITTEAQGNMVGTCPTRAFLIQGGTRTVASTLVDDSPIARAFASRASNIQVEGEGTVIRILEDDLDGRRHQRFIIQLASEQTLLIAHNIDVAPRINGLQVGDTVGFNGEYVWNAKGGVIHWTHHDPQGRHVTGWLKHKGRTFK